MPFPRILALSLLLVGCMRAPESAPAVSGTAPASKPQSKPFDDDCTLATALVPGIPGSPGHLIRSNRNPNGDSELAVLMRDFVTDLKEGRAALEAGKTVGPWHPRHRKMRCSWPTKPEERNERFDGLAQSYLALVKAFDAAPGKATYNGVISGCISCHAASCGGPLDFIEGMRWE